MSARLTTCLTEGEYQWIESTEEDYGRCWNGDVHAYLVSAAEDEEAMEAMISRDYHGAIHNLPQDAIVLTDEGGTPRWIYWAEDADGDPYLILYGTGAGEDEATSLQEALKVADDGACYTQRDIIIADVCGNPVLCRRWCGYLPSDEEEEAARDDSAVPGSDWIWFGEYGGYAPWQYA